MRGNYALAILFCIVLLWSPTRYVDGALGPGVGTSRFPGRYSKTGENPSTMFLCPAGTMCPSGGFCHDECMPCPDGTIPSSVEACRPCSVAPQFSNVYENGAYFECWSGYQYNSATHKCDLCPSGTYSSYPKNTEQCRTCPPGFQPEGGVGANSFQRIKCEPCPAGTVRNDASPGYCTNCPAGTYSSAGRTCVPCPNGQNSHAGSAACTADTCNTGYYYNAGRAPGSPFCLECPEGTFKNQVSLASSCTPCPSHMWQPLKGSTHCIPVPKGMYRKSLTQIDVVPAGKYYDGVGNAAVPKQCAKGHYSASTKSEACLPCPAGSSTLDQEGSTSCTPCDEGFIADSGEATCTKCPPGFSSAPGSKDCFACPVGTKKSVTDTVCVKCAPGHHTDTTGRPGCDKCPKGTYQPKLGSWQCIPCPVGTYQDSTGSITCIDTGTGHFSGTEPGATAKLPCVAGTFAGDTRNIECTPCPLGHVQPNSGSSSCNACNPGEYTNGTQICHDAPEGTYSIRFELPVECPDGLYQNAQGKTSCKDCPSNREYDPISKACVCREGYGKTTSSCKSCGIGFYKNISADVPCTRCPFGTLTQNPMATQATSILDCLPCPSGHYFDSTTFIETTFPIASQNQCKPCAPGTYAPTSGSTSCIPAEIGYLAVGGTAYQERCPPGTHSNCEGESQCTACPAHSSPAGNGTYCACNPGAIYSESKGDGKACGTILECHQCPAGQEQFSPTSCRLCRPGYFSDAVGTAQCKPCPAGYYTNFYDYTDTEKCVPCPKGTYNPESGRHYCLKCPVGTVAASEGTAQCTSCPTITAGEDDWGLPITEALHAPDKGTSECERCPANAFPKTIEAWFTTYSYCECHEGFVTTGWTVGTPAFSCRNCTCEACPAGQYFDYYDDDEHDALPKNHPIDLCRNCPAGTYSSTAGGVWKESCIPCPAGSFSSANSSSCTPCPPGTFSSGVRSAECAPCEKGTFSLEEGQTACTSCPANEYTDEERSLTCAPCPSGSHNDQLGQKRDQCYCSEGTYIAFANATTLICEPCPAGTYSTSSSAKACFDAPVGSYVPNPGMTAPLPCPPGKYSSQAGNAQCQLCDAGSFVSRSNATECVPCPPGTSQPIAGKADCVQCSAPNEYAARAGSTTCDLCPPGAIPDQGTRTRCLCPRGTFLLNNLCEPCPAGTYADQLGATSKSVCRNAPAGTYAVAGATRPILCPPGTASVNESSSSCTPCLPGHYQPLEGTTSCVPCKPSFYAASSGSTRCTLCESDLLYASREGQSSCDLCPANSLSSSTDRSLCTCQKGYIRNIAADPASPEAAMCTPCPPGSFNKVSNGTVCSLCSPGYHNPSPGASSCALCEATIAPQAGSSQCETCPADSIPNHNGTICECSVGYTMRKTEQGEDVCMFCPPGAVCDVPGQILENTEPAPGYWRTSATSLVFEECPQRDDACNKGECQVGYSGKLCSACASGYYRLGSSCAQCTVTEVFWLLFFVVCVANVGGIAFLIKTSRRRVLRTMKSDSAADGESTAPSTPRSDGNRSPSPNTDLEGKEGKELAVLPDSTVPSSAGDASLMGTDPVPPLPVLAKKTDVTTEGPGAANPDIGVSKPPQAIPDESAGPVQPLTIDQLERKGIVEREMSKGYDNVSFSAIAKITINYLQLASFATLFPLRWPTAITKMFAFQGQASDAGLTWLSGFECESTWSFYTRFSIVMCVPPAIALLSGVAWGAVYAIKKCQGTASKYPGISLGKDCLLGLGGCILICISLVHPFVARRSFQLFHCATLDTGEFLVADMALECGTAEHRSHALLAGILGLGVYTVALPLIALFVLFKYRDALDSVSVRLAMSYVYGGYRPARWYWEFTVVMTKVIIVGVASFYSSNTRVQGYLAAWVTQMAAVMHMVGRPYAVLVLHRLQFAALLVCASTLSLGLMFYAGVGEAIEILMTIAIVSAHALVSLALIYVLVKKLWLTISKRRANAVQPVQDGESNSGDTPADTSGESSHCDSSSSSRSSADHLSVDSSEAKSAGKDTGVV